MEILNVFKNIYLNGFQVYDGFLQKIVYQVINIYREYPYLLILLIILLGSMAFIVVWGGDKLVSLTLKEKSLFKENSLYKTLFKQYLAIYFAYEVFQKLFLGISNDLEFYELLIFKAVLSGFSALLYFTVIRALSFNAYDQYKIVIKLKANKLNILILNSSLFTYLLLYKFIQIMKWPSSLLNIIALIACLHLTSLLKNYRDSLSKVLNNILGDIPDKYVETLTGYLRFLTAVFICLMAFLLRIVFVLSYFEFTKKIAAQIIRHQVEKITREHKECELPVDYISLFDNIDLKYYQPNWMSETLNEVSSVIDDWDNDHLRESFVHLIGDPGSGRRVFVQQIEDKYKHLNPVTITIDTKISSKEEFHEFISKAVKNIDADEDEQNIKNQLVIFLHAENLFLNRPGGFEALKEMFNIINRSENDFFWINVFDQYPWKHIKGFFGHVNHRHVYELKSFSDEEIKRLIQGKNESLGYKIIFDRALYETTNRSGFGAQDTNAGTHFFRMLWEQSNGNIFMAQSLWVDSIQIFDNKNKKIKVGLPKRHHSEILKQSNNDTYFVYNALLKHSRLTFEECCTVTSLSPRIVRFALVYGENEKFIIKDEYGNLSIAKEWYAAMTQTLKTKNLIHG